MSIRYNSYSPNTILYQAQIQRDADNGVVQIDLLNDLTTVPTPVNVVYCNENFSLYIRKQDGVGSEADGTWSKVA